MSQTSSSTSVAKKFINGLTGLALVGFVILHLLGNLQLFSSNSEPFNLYAKTLSDLGVLLYVLEIGLLAVFVFHIVSAINVKLSSRKARSEGYHKTSNAGGNSKKSIFSQSMIWTGIVLLVFLIYHLKELKYGPGIAEGYITTIDGEQARDLYRLVYDYFASPLNVAIYVGVMLLLGFHLRHGFWSAFQTIGINHPKYTPVINVIGCIAAVVLAVGFLFIPVWIYFFSNGGY